MAVREPDSRHTGPSTREWLLALAGVVGAAALVVAALVLVVATFALSCGCVGAT